MNITVCTYLDAFPKFLDEYMTGIPLGTFRLQEYIHIFYLKQPIDNSYR